MSTNPGRFDMYHGAKRVARYAEPGSDQTATITVAVPAPPDPDRAARASIPEDLATLTIDLGHVSAADLDTAPTTADTEAEVVTVNPWQRPRAAGATPVNKWSRKGSGEPTTAQDTSLADELVNDDDDTAAVAAGVITLPSRVETAAADDDDTVVPAAAEQGEDEDDQTTQPNVEAVTQTTADEDPRSAALALVPASNTTVATTAAAPEALPPATWGARGVWNRILAPLRIQLPAKAPERKYRLAAQLISHASLSGAGTVAVANVKGGQGKTTVAAGLADLLSQHRGGGVVAFEACESPGTLRSRVSDADAAGQAAFVAAGQHSSVHDVARFVAKQPQHGHVLGDATPRPELDVQAVRLLHDELERFYSVTIADTANNPTHPVWQEATSNADVIVVPCWMTHGDLAAAQAMIEQLDQARVIVAAIRPATGAADENLARSLAETVVILPFEPALAQGAAIDVTAWSQASTVAWTTLAAHVITDLQTRSARMKENIT